MKKLMLLLLFITATGCLNNKLEDNQKVTEVKPNQDSILNINLWKKKEKLGDEFNSNNLDASKWKMGLWYDVSEDFAFKDENISVSDGNLHLTARSEKFKSKGFTIGAVESKFDFPAEPSLIRVRAKLLADSVNVCSTIWLQSWPEVVRNPNPEIDIIEYFYKNEMHMNLFTWDKDAAGKYEHVDYKGNVFDYKKDMSAQYHVYGLARVKGFLNFYFDDKLVCRWKCPNSNFSSMPRHVILSLEGHRSQPKVVMLPASFDIDWVRIYKK